MESNSIALADVPQMDVVGGKVQFLASPKRIGEPGMGILCGTFEGGAFVPLHSHPDAENFVIMEGEIEVYQDTCQTSGWTTISPGVLVIVQGGVKHAWRNRSTTKAVVLVFTGGSLFEGMYKMARPLLPTSEAPPLTPDVMQATLPVTQEYGFWSGTPEENAAIGLTLGAG